MVLLLPLFIPLAGALFVFLCRQPRVVVRAALTTGALQLAAICLTVYKIHSQGVLTAGRYLRADGLTSFFLISLGLISALVLVYSSGYLRHVPEGRFSSLLCAGFMGWCSCSCSPWSRCTSRPILE